MKGTSVALCLLVWQTYKDDRVQQHLASSPSLASPRPRLHGGFALFLALSPHRFAFYSRSASTSPLLLPLYSTMTGVTNKRAAAAEHADRLERLSRRRREAEAAAQAAEDAGDADALNKANADLDAVLSEIETLQGGDTPDLDEGDGDDDVDRRSGSGSGRDGSLDVDDIQVLYRNQTATARTTNQTAAEVAKLREQLDSVLASVNTLKRKRRDGESDEDCFAPLDAQFAFVDAKHFEAALAGKLAPDLLVHFIPTTHAFYRRVVDVESVSFVPEGVEAFRAVRPKKSEADTVKRFVSAIPSISVFCVAWMNLCTIMCHGLHDPPTAVRLHRAMVMYMVWIADCSSLYSWDSIVRYHIRFSEVHFAKGASDPDIWARAPDPRDMALLEKRSSGSSSAFNGASGNRQRRVGNRQQQKPSSSSADKEGPCLRWNHARCTTTKCRFSHTCALCGANHRLVDGHKA